MNEQSRRAKLYIIGAGPGDPELLTVKAVRVLSQCEVVLYDRLVSKGVLELTRQDAELIYVGKHEGEQESTQKQIFDLIQEHASRGKQIARLKGGDPFVFGRGAEEWALANELDIAVELIPGISSAIAVPSLAGIPLTYRGLSQSFAVVTAHCLEGRAEDWRRFAAVDTLVVLMGVRNRAFIAQSLLAAGRAADEPAAFIENGTTSQERVIESTLEDVAQGRIEVKSPSIFVIGAVVRVRARLATTDAIPKQLKPAARE